MTTKVHVQIDPLAGAITRCHRLLLTGVGSNLGKVLRERLPKYADSLRLSDISNLGGARTGEETVSCDLADVKAVDVLVAGTDVIVHLDGVSVEQPFEEIPPASIVGTYSLYEAARRHGVRRIVFTSSNHTIGFYRQGEVIDSAVPTRPDGCYGLSKVLGEQLASFYFDRYGIETVAIHIGSSFAEAKDRRMLAIWLGYDGLEQLIRRALFVPNVGLTVVYGMSNNRDR